MAKVSSPKSTRSERPQTAPQSTLEADLTSGLPFQFSSLPSLLAFGALCLLLVLSPVQLSGFWVVDNDYGPQALLLGITACVCLAIALSPRQSSPHSLRLTPHSISFWLALFFGWSCLSLITSVYRHDSLLELSRLAAALIWFPIVQRLLVCSDQSTLRRRATWLLGTIVAGAVVVSLVALNSYRQEATRQFATFFNPNLFANYCATALPLTLAWTLLLRRQAGAKVLWMPPTAALVAGAITFVLIVGGLLVSYSKGGLLSSFVGLLVFVMAVVAARGATLKRVIRTHRKLAIMGSLVFVVVAGALFGKTVLPRLRAARTSDDHSTMFRVYTWQSTLKMAQSRPFLGWGAGSFPSAYGQFAVAGTTRSAHQSWLQIAAETGWPSLLFLFGAIGLAARRGWRALKGDNWPIAAGSVGALAALVAHGFTDAGWGIISIVLLFAVVLALMESAKCEVQSVKFEESQLAPHDSRLNYGWLAATLIFAGASSWVQRVATAEGLLAESIQLERQGNPTAALEVAKISIEAAPLSARMWSNLAFRAGNSPGAAADAKTALHHALELQSTRAANWVNLGHDYDDRSYPNNARTFLDRAVALEPNNTAIRLARAQMLIGHGERYEPRAWDDLEFISKLRETPYGRYPATPEIVNLDFARAETKLAERALEQKKFERARELIERSLDDVVRAKAYAKDQEKMAQALRQSGDTSITIGPARDLPELESQLQNLQRRLGAAR